jgi:hypothetical protein
MLFALFLDWYIPRRLDWPLYRWALSGTAFGILLGSYLEPIRLVRGGKIEASGRGWIIVGIGAILASVVKLLDGRRVGSALGGMVGGAIGGLGASTILAAVGGKEAAEWLGNYLVIPTCGTLLGALGGACSGWVAWSIAEAGARQAIVDDHNAPSEHYG